MHIFDKLKNLGDVEIPLSLVVVVVAITVVMVYQPKKEVTFVWPISMEQIKSHQIHSV
jgi:hypothetical protein